MPFLNYTFAHGEPHSRYTHLTDVVEAQEFHYASWGLQGALDLMQDVDHDEESNTLTFRDSDGNWLQTITLTDSPTYSNLMRVGTIGPTLVAYEVPFYMIGWEIRA